MTEMIGVGATLFDIPVTAEGFPKEDTKIQGSSTKLQCGGPYTTALVAVSRLRISAEYMGALGDDMYGSFTRREFTRFDMGYDSVGTVEGGQLFHSFVLIDTEKSTGTCIWNRGMLLLPETGDMDLKTFSGTKYLHLDGHHPETAIYTAGKARTQGIKANLDTGGICPGIEKLLPLVDVPIPSEEFALAVTGERKVEKAVVVLMGRYHPEVLVITQGSRGRFTWEKGQVVRYPVYPVKAINTNGAGGTFHGAFLVGRVRGMTIYGTAPFASAVSALKCTRFGAQDGVPGYGETVEFIGTNKRR